MSLTISSITIEFFWGRYAYFSGFGRNVFIKGRTGLPFWFFSKNREGDALELWGFGLTLVTDPNRRMA